MIFYKNIKQLLLILTITLFIACGGSESGGTPSTNLDKASLVFPLKDAECNQGNIISETTSKVKFEWNAVKNADRYTLILTNLEDNSVKNISTTEIFVEENLVRGNPYSWSIISRIDGVTETSKSDTWKFYNAGASVENYAPFPADLVSPANGSSVETSVTINWLGNDIDDDIDHYEIYLDSTNPPTTLNKTTNQTNVSLDLESNKIYYWQVVTKDSYGNASSSPVFEFRTK